MGKFETSITNPTLAAKLQGLDLQAITIAGSEELSARLNNFIETYVAPDMLQLDTLRETHTYDHKRVSALGRAGTLLHARLHSYPLPDNDTTLRNLVVVGSIYSDDPAELLTARSIEQPGSSPYSTETVLEIGRIEDPYRGAWPIPDGMTEAEWAEQQELAFLLEREARQQASPQVRFGKNGWSYRHKGGMVEPLQDMLSVRQSVDLAVYRGLGGAAAVLLRHEASLPPQHAEAVSN